MWCLRKLWRSVFTTVPFQGEETEVRLICPNSWNPQRRSPISSVCSHSPASAHRAHCLLFPLLSCCPVHPRAPMWIHATECVRLWTFPQKGARKFPIVLESFLLHAGRTCAWQRNRKHLLGPRVDLENGGHFRWGHLSHRQHEPESPRTSWSRGPILSSELPNSRLL